MFFEETNTTWSKLLKPAVCVPTPFRGMAGGGQTKSPELAQATTNTLKTISVGEILSLIDMHGNGLS